MPINATLNRNADLSMSKLCDPSPHRPFASRKIEAIVLHTTPILPDQILTCLLRVGGVGEEHAFVAGRLLVFADAAGLYATISIRNTIDRGGEGGAGTLTLGAAS